MATLAITEVLEFAGVTITVREWTLAEIRAHLAKFPGEQGSFDPVSALLIEGWDLKDVALFTDVTAADLDPLSPSQIRHVLGAIERVNVDFFATCGRLKGLATEVAARSESLKQQSPA